MGSKTNSNLQRHCYRTMGRWRGEAGARGLAGDETKVEGNFMEGPQLSTRHAKNRSGWLEQRHMFPNQTLFLVLRSLSPLLGVKAKPFPGLTGLIWFHSVPYLLSAFIK